MARTDHIYVKNSFFRDTVLLKLWRFTSQPNSMLWCLVTIISLNITTGHNNNNNNNFLFL
jgi:hypothetical protein